jgi:hypothetical protein
MTFRTMKNYNGQEEHKALAKVLANAIRGVFAQSQHD